MAPKPYGLQLPPVHSSRSLSHAGSTGRRGEIEPFVECTGLVGAGKSTVCLVIRHLLETDNVQALSLDEALEVCLRRSALMRVARRLLPKSITDRLVRVGYLRVLEYWYALSFACKNPRLTWSALKSQWRLPLSLADRWVALSRFFRLGGRYRFLRHRLRPTEVTVLDEGLVHRAITLYAWNPKGIDRRELVCYLGELPATRSLIVVRAPRDVSLKRVMVRGVPTRFRNRDGRAIERFMENSEQIVAVASAFWVEVGRDMVEIDNSGPLDDTVSDLCRWLAHAI